ncbi:PTPLA-domain-containing protein [Clavulina sp. PMI_390]|nr:PTPLA-domain-containing protein [Clavulina sp. PMI_390]
MSGRGRKPSPIVSTYLIAYNILSNAGWAYILFLTYFHLSGTTSVKPISTELTSYIALAVQKAISYLPPVVQPSSSTVAPLSGAGLINTALSYLPAEAAPYVARAKTLYSHVGNEVAFVQTFAVFEVFHVILRLVQTSFGTTLMQVSSRIWLVWGIVERFPETKQSPLYATMVTAWCFAEIIRYKTYALTLMGMQPYALTWLRYTAFYILYPLGAGSEAFVMFSTLPALNKIGTSVWGTDDYVRGALFVLWWPGLMSMMGHMASQRRKVLGRIAKGKSKAE